ncbi:MAG: Asp-tRNA(Asn)/Glu-tRNA(Gln) amidotransferase subunit GatA [Candidatus Dojkabacteria bacterium]|nr:Asp-tRNA(Asn)/Glu-tRNA(Gln) amidotransferase subunit GatA [Candidatus Dojkabacteria bacterium]
MKELYDLTVKDASKMLTAGEITARELVDACLDRISEMEPAINAFITICAKQAREHAIQVDQRRAQGKTLHPLAGIPYSLKDVYVTEGIQTTAGSKILEGYVPPYDATVFKRLKDADCILIGKTNCDPYGFGSSTEHSAFGVTKNPVDTSRVPGGSSGGSGAAVQYGGGLFSIGEDTGGSIRCPASFCGVVGLKPTYGRVSRYGSIAYASSYDSVGPITKTVEDAALVMSVIAGTDPNDATTPDQPVPNYQKTISDPINGRTVGIPKEYFGEGVSKDVLDVLESAKERLQKLGCTLKEMSLPYTEYAIATYYIIGLSEASSNLARYDGVRFGLESDPAPWKEYYTKVRGEGFSDEEKRRIMIGTFTLSSGYQDQYYKRAQEVRQLLRQDFERAFREVDVIITPTMPMTAFKIGDKTDDPLQMWLADAFTVSINPVGIPALSVPAGNTPEGLPVGMQIIAPHFKEELLFNFGHQFQTA